MTDTNTRITELEQALRRDEEERDKLTEQLRMRKANLAYARYKLSDAKAELDARVTTLHALMGEKDIRLTAAEERNRELQQRNDQLIADAQHWLTIGRENDELRERNREHEAHGAVLQAQLASALGENYGHETRIKALQAELADATRRNWLKRETRKSLEARIEGQAEMLSQRRTTIIEHERTIESLRAVLKPTIRLLERLSSFLGFVEASRELDGEEPLSDHANVAHFMGNGASHAIHVADLREARQLLTAIAALTEEPT